MSKVFGILGLALCVCGLVWMGTGSSAAPPDKEDPAAKSNAAAAQEEPTEGAAMEPTRFRATELIGMGIHDADGEQVGVIEDLVIDMEMHDLRYAALSMDEQEGKLFPVPVQALAIQHPGEGEECFVQLDLPADTWERAPSFSSDSWPDFNDPRVDARLDEFYTTLISSTAPEAAGETQAGLVVSATEDMLVISDASGESEETLEIGADVAVTIDGRPAELSDLEEGQSVTLQTTNEDGEIVVLAVIARTVRK